MDSHSKNLCVQYLVFMFLNILKKILLNFSLKLPLLSFHNLFPFALLGELSPFMKDGDVGINKTSLASSLRGTSDSF